MIHQEKWNIMCVCVCRYMCIYRCAGIYMCVYILRTCIDLEINVECCLRVLSTLFFETYSLTEPRASLAGQWAPSCLYLSMLELKVHVVNGPFFNIVYWDRTEVLMDGGANTLSTPQNWDFFSVCVPVCMLLAQDGILNASDCCLSRVGRGLVGLTIYILMLKFLIAFLCVSVFVPDFHHSGLIRLEFADTGRN